MLHLNELPLQHTFSALDGLTKSPDKFSCPIGSMLNGIVSQWQIVKFKSIPYLFFPVKSLMIFQLISIMGIAHAGQIITGEVDEDLSNLEIGPLNHSRWFILAC